MRTLKFIVDGQIIKQDPNCDFSDIVPGTDGYLQAEFSFSSDWKGCVVRVASFSSVLGVEYEPQALKNGKTCMIPKEALERKEFRVQVVGKRSGFTIRTNKVSVIQDGGAK